MRLVAGTFVDLAGVTRVKAVPIERFAAFAEYGVGLSTVSTVFTVDDQIASSPGFDSPIGDMRLRPDLDAVVALPDAPGWAWAPVVHDDQELVPMPTCPRHTLARLVRRAEQAGLRFRMATEIEFTLMTPDGAPLHHGPAYGARALEDVADLALDLVQVLEDLGIPVEQLHPEYATSQYEVSVGATDPVRAADRTALVRSAITRVARRHGARVSFAPRATDDDVGNGAHLHLSAWSDDRNLMTGGPGRFGMTSIAESLLAGILHHLPELSAVLAPSVPSYARLRPTRWSAPFTCWGRENREAALRVVTGTLGTRTESANVELKPIDGSANPYLVMAVVIAAGLAGLESDLDLPEPISVDPATLSDDQRAARGVHRLPRDLDEAIARMSGSALLREALGAPLFEAHLSVRRLEADTFRDLDVATRVRAHRWRYG